MPLKPSPISLFLCFFLALLGVLLSMDHVFFWDTIQLGSKHAHFYYENHFKVLLLPEKIDSGHPPLFGLYLAICWAVFGKNLLVSHLSMLPFLWLIIYQWYRLGRYLGGVQLLPFFMLLLVADPVMAGQAVLVSPDLVLVASWLLALNGILLQQKEWKTFGIIGLGLISMRGMMLGLILFLWEWGVFRKKEKETSFISHFFKTIYAYLPGGMLALVFLVYHYTETGWIGYHENSEWAPSFAKASVAQIVKNGLILAWRLVDFGRIFVWLGLLALVWKLLAQKTLIDFLVHDKKVRQIGLLFIFTLLGLSITFIRYAGLQQHRYLLPVCLSLSIFLYFVVVHSPSHLWKMKSRQLLLLLVSFGLFSGNFWIYPDKISQGWDASLAHWPYYDLRAQMLEHIEAQAIPLDAIGTAFPEIGPLKYKDLSEETGGFKEKDFSSDQFLLYSNIMNDFTDEELEELQTQWEPIYKVRKAGVFMVLYKR
ncbi:MAG: hypothetical protein R2828_30865 [Saprospiraceae bacterium]